MQYFSMKFTTTQIIDRQYVNIFAFGIFGATRLAYVRYTNSKFEFCYFAGDDFNSMKLESLRIDQSSHTCTDVIATGGDINNKQWIMTVLPAKISITSVADGSKGELDVDLSENYYGADASVVFYTKLSGNIHNTPSNTYEYFHENADINMMQLYEYKASGLNDAAGVAPTAAKAYTCMENPPVPPTDCVAAWSDCDKASCTETFTASTQPENGGQTCLEVYGIDENATQSCTCPTVTAAEVTELNGKDANVVARFNTLRGKAALQGIGAATFAKVAEFDLRELDASQKKEALKTVVTATVQTMKLKIGGTDYEGARARSQNKKAAVDFATLTEEDRLTPQQPQVFVLPNDYPQVITVKRTNKVLIWDVNSAGDQPVARPSTRRLLAATQATQGDCDASITATNDDGVIYVSERSTPGCYYDAASDEVLVCPVGHSCDGIDKTPCPEGTYTSSVGEPNCRNAAPGYAVGTGNTDKGDCATHTIDLQNCGCCTGCGACPGIGEGLTDAEVLSAVASQCGGTC